MKKRGISAIVATVLMVLMVVVAVGIVYTLILPMFGGINEFSYEDATLGISLEGYTFYDPDEGIAFVQIKRGNDNLELSGMKIIFYGDGDSITYEVNGSEVPEPNSKKTYAFPVKRDGIEDPEEVSVVPIIKQGNGEVEGSVSSRVSLPSSSASFSPADWSQARSEASSRVSTDWIELNGCAELIKEGGKYYVSNDGSSNWSSGFYFDDSGEDYCFNIGADGIYLNLGDYEYVGDGSVSCVYATGVSGISVYGGEIKDGYDNAIKFEGVDSSVIYDVLVEGVYNNGVYLSQSDSNTLYDLNILDVGNGGASSADGVELSYSDNNIVRDSVIGSVAGAVKDEGIEIEAGNGNIIENVQIYNVSGNCIKVGGVSAIDSSDGNSVSDVVLGDCGTDGLELKYASDNVFSNFEIYGSADEGIQLGDSYDNSFSGFTIFDSATSAILINDESSRNSFDDFEIDNAVTGLYVGEEDKDSRNNNFTNGLLTDLSRAAHIYSSSYNLFENLILEDVSSYGFYIQKKTSIRNSFSSIALCSPTPHTNFRCPSTPISEYYGGVSSTCSNLANQENAFVPCPD